MKTKEIQIVEYNYGEEEKIKALLYKSKEPILLKIKNFTDEFSLDYFEKNIDAETLYSVFEKGRLVAIKTGNFAKIISQIKNNLPLRIFGQILPRVQSAKVEAHVPLWQKIPFRPRFFLKKVKVAYFFGGRDGRTEMHFDREHCCNLHLCLSGKKQFLLFTEEQNKYLYKRPFVGDSVVDFSESMDLLCEKFPKLKQAEGYNVLLEKGDMLFMPRNCWHYTTYLEASSAATYVFYPKKSLQVYGCFTGYFYLGHNDGSFFKMFHSALYKEFSERYALSTGIPEFLYKLVEKIAFVFLLPVVSLRAFIEYRLKARKIIY